MEAVQSRRTQGQRGGPRRRDPAVLHRAEAQRALRQIVRRAMAHHSIPGDDPLWSGPAEGRFRDLVSVTATAFRLSLPPCTLHAPYLASLTPEALEYTLGDLLDAGDTACTVYGIRLLARGLRTCGVPAARTQVTAWLALLDLPRAPVKAERRALSSLRAAALADAPLRAGVALAALSVAHAASFPEEGDGSVRLLREAREAVAAAAPNPRLLGHLEARLARACLGSGYVPEAIAAATRALACTAFAFSPVVSAEVHRVLLEAYVELGDTGRAFLEASQGMKTAGLPAPPFGPFPESLTVAALNLAEVAHALGSEPGEVLHLLENIPAIRNPDVGDVCPATSDLASTLVRTHLFYAYMLCLAGDTHRVRQHMARARELGPSVPERPYTHLGRPALTLLATLTRVTEARLLLAEGRAAEAHLWLEPVFTDTPMVLSPARLDSLAAVLLRETVRDAARKSRRPDEGEERLDRIARARESALPVLAPEGWQEAAERLLREERDAHLAEVAQRPEPALALSTGVET